MAQKRPNQKEILKRYLTEHAIKIKCRYCELAGNCQWQAKKEASEKTGVVTKCTLTPNRRVLKKGKGKSVNSEIVTFQQYLSKLTRAQRRGLEELPEYDAVVWRDKHD